MAINTKSSRSMSFSSEDLSRSGECVAGSRGPSLTLALLPAGPAPPQEKGGLQGGLRAGLQKPPASGRPLLVAEEILPGLHWGVLEAVLRPRFGSLVQELPWTSRRSKLLGSAVGAVQEASEAYRAIWKTPVYMLSTPGV